MRDFLTEAAERYEAGRYTEAAVAAAIAQAEQARIANLLKFVCTPSLYRNENPMRSTDKAVQQGMLQRNLARNEIREALL